MKVKAYNWHCPRQKSCGSTACSLLCNKLPVDDMEGEKSLLFLVKTKSILCHCKWTTFIKYKVLSLNKTEIWFTVYELKSQNSDSVFDHCSLSYLTSDVKELIQPSEILFPHFKIILIKYTLQVLSWAKQAFVRMRSVLKCSVIVSILK